MTAVGGSITSLTIKGRNFAVASDADANRKLGGYENEVQMNGNGTGRKIMTAVGWAVDGITVETDDSRGDQEFLQEVADETGFVDISYTLASGATYQGTGTITGEIQSSSQNATAGIALGGPGQMTKQ